MAFDDIPSYDSSQKLKKVWALQLGILLKGHVFEVTFLQVSRLAARVGAGGRPESRHDSQSRFGPDSFQSKVKVQLLQLPGNRGVSGNTDPLKSRCTTTRLAYEQETTFDAWIGRLESGDINFSFGSDTPTGITGINDLFPLGSDSDPALRRFSNLAEFLNWGLNTDCQDNCRK
ncbi:hypothetical protein ARMGADRAFT_1060735 [Armillaria gallica]|uniref:Uncharacterized protein n=1 Tax=Armillaria gallica TaxID=47427 RepID=A0A2H3E368_ARMGA|nr:hypothetical protein ARMGADRAFT_1060735 [Armillaria gallica]